MVLHDAPTLGIQDSERGLRLSRTLLRHQLEPRHRSATAGLPRRPPIPGHRLLEVLLDPMAPFILGSEVHLRLNMALLRRHSIPSRRLHVVLRHSPPCRVEITESHLPLDQPLLGRPAIPPRRLSIVLSYALARSVETTEGHLCVDRPLLSRPLIPSSRLHQGPRGRELCVCTHFGKILISDCL